MACAQVHLVQDHHQHQHPQVHLVQDPDHRLDAQYVNPPARGLTVRLYEVNQVGNKPFPLQGILTELFCTLPRGPMHFATPD